MRGHFLRMATKAVPPLLSVFPGALGAYSLRSLTGGNPIVLRVRRSSDNAESDFTVSEVAGSGLTSWAGGSSVFVTTWYDQSGNGRHAVQADWARQPRIALSGVLDIDSGLPVLYFSTATNQDLRVTSAAAVKPLHFFFTSRFRSLAGSVAVPLTLLDGLERDSLDLREDGSKLEIYGGAFLYQGSQGFNTTTNLYEVFFNSTTSGSSYYLNGASVVASGNASDVGTSGGFVIGNYSPGDRTPNANISEVVVYGSSQSASRSGIAANIKGYYGIP